MIFITIMKQKHQMRDVQTQAMQFSKQDFTAHWSTNNNPIRRSFVKNLQPNCFVQT